MHYRPESTGSTEVPDELVAFAPADAPDPVIDVFKKDLDRTLLVENLRLSPHERAERFLRNMRLLYELRRAGQAHRRAKRAA